MARLTGMSLVHSTVMKHGRSDGQRAKPARSGELTAAWLVVIVGVWAAIIAGFAAVWAASRQIGLSTWWLGPPAGGRPLAVHLVVFLPPLSVIAAALGRARHVWVIGLIASGTLIAVGIGDLGRVSRLGFVEIALGAAGFATSIASWSGTLRAGPSSHHDR